MRRLVYAPKAYAFIRSSNLDGRIFNVSSDIVSGTVARNINALSTASLVLRNRYFKWILYRNPSDPTYNGRQLFLPMDMITIWLQRIAGAPVQVFTGYLDSVPYYQMYPGNCNITASCTLKKLAFEWFDPGLNFFQNWINSEPGWKIDPSTGNAVNLTALGQLTSIAPTGLGASTTVNDGGFAKLIYDFMVEIAAWSPQDIIISRLPSDLGIAAAKMFQNINTDADIALKQLEGTMSALMGINYVSPGQNPDGTATDANTAIAAQIYAEAANNNVPPLVAIAAALATTQLKANFNSTTNGSGWGGLAKLAVPGYGLYAMSSDQDEATIKASQGATRNNPAPSSPGSPGGPDGPPAPGLTLSELTIDNVPVNYILGDVAVATQVFCRAAFKASFGNSSTTQKDYVAAVYNQAPNVVRKKVYQWISDTLLINNNNAYFTSAAFESTFATAVTLAKNVAAQGSGFLNSTPTPTTKSGGNIDWTSPELKALCDATDDLRSYTGANADPVLAGILYKAKTQGKANDLHLVNPEGSARNPNVIYISGSNPQNVAQFALSFVGDSGTNEVTATIPAVDPRQTGVGATEYISILYGVKGALIRSAPPMNTVRIYTTQQPAPVSSSTAQDAGAVVPLTFQAISRLSANAAFAAQFTFPVNVVESQSLVGDKALMNDTSCLDAVQQFCQASMRNFMSLPDGRFLAFYPDYFGTHGRKPYWWIHNSEIIDMGIQLNDDALATHVYVVGDSFAGTGSGDADEEVINEIGTRGVATLAQAAILNGFLDPDADQTSPWGRLQDVGAFLQHYGARPHKESEPLIRNAMYEFLLAWQRFMQLWAGQFQTTAQFAFQPEIFAGGIIGFPEHNLQVYVESVTHNFDYSSGFTTDAVVSSPAELSPSQTNRNAGLNPTPGFALAGNVNTVAGGALG